MNGAKIEFSKLVFEREGCQMVDFKGQIPKNNI
jgi:hypothetical protein